ncbi:transient receptor potential channel pyrexia-like [Cloeon dipterum]|uniref:transient receptor potential channel pyrexia-like n=1 Tax=Cloeon dipterum TaxID=197152 RepID=UPI0032205E61
MMTSERISSIRTRRNSYLYERYHELESVKKHLEVNLGEIKGQLNGLVAFNNLNEIQQALSTGVLHVLDDLTEHQFDVLFLASACRGDFQTLNLMLSKSSTRLPDIQFKKMNALHLAIVFRHSTCVEAFLVSEELRNLWLSSTYEGYRPLHLATFHKCSECVDVIVNYIRHELELNKRASRPPYVTPLHIAAMLDCSAVAKTLLEAGADSEVTLQVETYTPLHLAALYDNTLTAEVLLQMGASLKATTPEGMSALALVEIHVPQALTCMLDSCIKLETTKEYRIITFDTRLLMEEPNKIRTSLLSLFVSSNCIHGLTHPVCKTIIEDKWARVRKWYLPHFTLSFFLTLFTTISILASRTCLCKFSAKSSYIECKSSCSGIFSSTFTATFVVEMSRVLLAPLIFYKAARKSCGIFVLSSQPTHLLSLASHFKKISNLTEWFCLITTMCIILTDQENTQILNDLSPVVVLLSWFHFMFLFEKLPWYGTYISMYEHVLKSYLKLLSAYIWLFIGYSIAFTMIFQANPDFTYPLKSLSRTMVMMTGEYEYENLFRTNGTSMLQLNDNLSQATAYIIFLTFIIALPIILMNMLIGIVVHDVTDMKKNAKIATMRRTIRLVEHLELIGDTVRGCLGLTEDGAACRQLSDDFMIVYKITKKELICKEALAEAINIALHNSAYG